jgi:hypothetical protein
MNFRFKRWARTVFVVIKEGATTFSVAKKEGLDFFLAAVMPPLIQIPNSFYVQIIKKKYYINPNINCKHSGIYGITCKCVDQYSGKTTVTNGKRFGEHWSKSTSVRTHLNSCSSKPRLGEVKVQFLENVWDRGKYSLSEREYLWNKRLKGTINIQKVLSK